MSRRSCREIARAMAMGEPISSSLALSDEVATHLSGCPPCAAFELQLALVTEVVRQASLAYEAEVPADFEVRLLQRLCS